MPISDEVAKCGGTRDKQSKVTKVVMMLGIGDEHDDDPIEDVRDDKAFGTKFHRSSGGVAARVRRLLLKERPRATSREPGSIVCW